MLTCGVVIFCFQVDTMMETFLSRHDEDELKAKLDLSKRHASQQGLKALESSASRRDLLEEEEKVIWPFFET